MAESYLEAAFAAVGPMPGSVRCPVRTNAIQNLKATTLWSPPGSHICDIHKLVCFSLQAQVDLGATDKRSRV